MPTASERHPRGILIEHQEFSYNTQVVIIAISRSVLVATALSEVIRETHYIKYLLQRYKKQSLLLITHSKCQIRNSEESEILLVLGN